MPLALMQFLGITNRNMPTQGTNAIKTIARALLDGLTVDTTGGADYFYSPRSMPKEGDNTNNHDVRGWLELIQDSANNPNNKKNYRPGWSTTYTRVTITGIREWYMKVYSN